MERITAQLRFIAEAERLKTVMRRNVVWDTSRPENSAEHSWQLGLMAMLLAEHSDQPVDLPRTLMLLLTHDLVEVYAGDTCCHDEDALRDRDERERAGAERLFALLPPDQCEQMWSLWREFEASQTAEARLANALDRLQPLLLHSLTGGVKWREHGIRRSQVLARMAPIRLYLPSLWPTVEERVDAAVAAGALIED